MLIVDSGTKSKIGFTYYTKLVAAMFSLLSEVAAQNPKYTDVVFMENNHFFSRCVTRCGMLMRLEIRTC